MRFLVFLIPIFVFAQTIEEKKASFAKTNQEKEAQIQEVNGRLAELRRGLQTCFVQASTLESGSEEQYKTLLGEANSIRKEILSLEDRWRESAVKESMKNEDGYALWDQEETTLSQLVMEYGSPDYLYLVPPDLGSLKLNSHSNIPIPRESWSQMLELVLMHNGIGVKRLNTYARQLYVLKQDQSAIQAIVSRPEELAWVASGARVFYLFSPPLEQTRTVFQFFEKFADAKQTFVHQIGGKIGIVSSKDEIEKLLSLYRSVWEGREGKVSKVVGISKMSAKEMERILMSFFGDAMEKPMPFGKKTEHDGFAVFPLGQSNNLVLIGSKESVDRAEQIVHDTEEQLEDPAAMTVFLYKCRHTDPSDLAKVLEKVYVSLINIRDDGTRETDVVYTTTGPNGKIPDGYPALSPLVVSPPPLDAGLTSHFDIQQGSTDHFIADPKTGNLLMTVRRDALPRLQELLKKLDVPKKMVEIEVLLFERRLSSQNNFGMNLLKLGKSDNGVTYTSLYGTDAKHHHKGILQFFFHGAATKYTPHFDIAYSFLMTLDDMQLNAAPSVVTVNQTPATIKIVEEISINNGAAPVDTNKGTTFEKSFARQQYGVIINLTPTIHPPEKESDKGQVTLKTNITFDTHKPDPDNRPIIDRRTIENEIRVDDGETVILGGLRRKSKRDIEEKIPFFGSLPIIGRLFGTTQLTDSDTEMFFFITPKIINDPKEELAQIRNEKLKKRAGDIPEFVEKMVEAKDREKRRYFKRSMKTFLTHER
jgi:general secretion pathway protein D